MARLILVLLTIAVCMAPLWAAGAPRVMATVLEVGKGGLPTQIKAPALKTLPLLAGPMTLSLLEAMDAGSAVAHCGGDDTYSTFYQAGLVTHEIIGAAQVGPRGEPRAAALWTRSTCPSGRRPRDARRCGYVPTIRPLSMARCAGGSSVPAGECRADTRWRL